MTDANEATPRKRGRPAGTTKPQSEALTEALGRLADNVERACEFREMTATDLQTSAELARSTLYNLRKSDPQISTIYAIAKALDLPPYLLLMGPDDLRHFIGAVLDAPLGGVASAEGRILEALLPAGEDPDSFSLGALVGERLSLRRAAPPVVTSSLEGVPTIADWMRSARSVVVLTGAGMSTEANYLDFRSDKGLRTMFPDHKDLSTSKAFNEDFDRFVAYYRYRIKRLEDAVSHSGHHILASWVKERRIERLITLNTDGLHTIDDDNPALELQGSIRGLYCTSCSQGFLSTRYLETGGEWCGCGGKLRPTVLFHGETPKGAIARNQQLAVDAVRNASLILVLGSSLTNNMATRELLKTRWGGTRLVIVNQDDTPLDPVADAVIQGSVRAFLTRLNLALIGRKAP